MCPPLLATINDSSLGGRGGGGGGGGGTLQIKKTGWEKAGAKKKKK